MKLIYRMMTRIAMLLVIVLGVWSVFFYVAVIDEVNDEVDDSLEDYSEYIIIRALAGEELPSENNGSNNQYYLRRVSAGYAASREKIIYKDSMIYLKEKGETEPARMLITLFSDDAGQDYELTVLVPAIEKRDLKEAILGWMVFLFGVLLLTILLLTGWVVWRSMQPLYRLLSWLDDYRIGGENRPLDRSTQITEFRRLNEAACRNAERSERLFEQQKQFIGNASHEMQTPLAICQNRLEMLLEEESLTERQVEEIAKTLQTLEHITRLNKSLLLLSKIDNGQFVESRRVEINALVGRYLEDYCEVYAFRGITAKVEEQGTMVVEMNESLAAVLMTNLLKNAFVHNIDGGHLGIVISEGRISFRNSGEGHPLDAAHIFDRFYQGSRKEGSTGLGLAIVDSICRLYGLHLEYRFADGEHCFDVATK